MQPRNSVTFRAPANAYCIDGQRIQQLSFITRGECHGASSRPMQLHDNAETLPPVAFLCNAWTTGICFSCDGMIRLPQMSCFLPAVPCRFALVAVSREDRQMQICRSRGTGLVVENSDACWMRRYSVSAAVVQSTLSCLPSCAPGRRVCEMGLSRTCLPC